MAESRPVPNPDLASPFGQRETLNDDVTGAPMIGTR
jgi:hypothetical protein